MTAVNQISGDMYYYQRSGYRGHALRYWKTSVLSEPIPKNDGCQVRLDFARLRYRRHRSW